MEKAEKAHQRVGIFILEKSLHYKTTLMSAGIVANCWKNAYARGVGTIAGLEVCAPGYLALGPLCREDCGPDFTSVGPLCTKPADRYRVSYHSQAACEAENGAAACEEGRFGWYRRCDPGFHASGFGPGFGTCSKDCPPGRADLGRTCSRDSYVRSRACPGERQLQNGLCYNPCATENWWGEGPVCWLKCSADTPYTCGGALCTKNKTECSKTLLSMAAFTLAAVSLAGGTIALVPAAATTGIAAPIFFVVGTFATLLKGVIPFVARTCTMGPEDDPTLPRA